jgi:DNA-binding CsgD family transcriptional regulator
MAGTATKELPTLTPRQLEIIELVAAGCSNEEIGERLGISPRTAKAHCDTLRHKLGVRRRRNLPYVFRDLTGIDPLSLSEQAQNQARKQPGAAGG